MSQQDLGDKLHVGARRVSAWERGEFLPKKQNLEKIVKALARNEKEEEELRRAWQAGQIERRAEPAARKAVKALLRACHEAIRASKWEPNERRYRRVEPDAWNTMVRHMRQVKQHYGDD